MNKIFEYRSGSLIRFGSLSYNNFLNYLNSDLEEISSSELVLYTGIKGISDIFFF